MRNKHKPDVATSRVNYFNPTPRSAITCCPPGAILISRDEMTQPQSNSQRDAVPAGTLLNGYRFLDVLGRGGFGITYRATDLLDQSFAIKEFFTRQFGVRAGLEVVATSDSDESIFIECRRRFLTESRLLAMLGRDGGTPGVVRVITFFEANNTAYSVMELLHGKTLDEALREKAQPFSCEELTWLLRGVLEPLGKVHDAGFLHRDLKPSNVLIREDRQPVLIDFGSARHWGPTSSTTYTQVYSGNYAPIEQMIPGAAQGPYSDLYAVGGIAYRSIGGQLVDARARQHAVLGHMPDPLIPAVDVGRNRYPGNVLRAIDRALAVYSQDRPQRVDELLGAFADDFTTRVTSPSAAARSPLRATRDAAHTTQRFAPTAAAAGGRMSGATRVKLAVAAVAIVVAVGITTSLSLWASRHQHGSNAALRADQPEAVASADLPGTPAETGPPAAPAQLRPVPPPIEPSSTMAPSVPPSTDRSPLAPVSNEATVERATAPSPPMAPAPKTAPVRSAPVRAPAPELRNARNPEQLHTRANNTTAAANTAGDPPATSAPAAVDQRRHQADREASASGAEYFQQGFAAYQMQQYDEARRLYLLGAAKGNANAMFSLGLLYAEGLGVPRDMVQAQSWYEKSAERGNSTALYNIGLLYLQDSPGRQRDCNAARHWFTMAAQHGSKVAQEWLAAERSCS